MKLPKLSKPVIITLAVTAGLVVGGATVSQSEAALDWLGLEQKITNHDEQLDNHDDRITNTEKDVDKLQENTETPEAPDKVIVREVVTQNVPVEQDAEPTSVVVESFLVIPKGSEFNCKYTYSDGTTKTFRWKWFTANRAEDGQLETITHTDGYCDNRAIGQVK